MRFSGSWNPFVLSSALSCFHSPGVNHWSHGKWRGWDGPAHHGQGDKWSSGGHPQTHHSCPWGFGAPDPAKVPGQSLLCPGNGWRPFRWHCSAGPASPRGGGPVRQTRLRSWSLLCFQKRRRYNHWECSSGDGEGWIGFFLVVIFKKSCGNRKIQQKKIYEKGYAVWEDLSQVSGGFMGRIDLQFPVLAHYNHNHALAI